MKKGIVLLLVLLAATATSNAQIGYKGQVSLSAQIGIDRTNSIVYAADIDRYFSAHSVIGIGGTYSRIRYDAAGGDAFHATQWIGDIHYRYAIPLNRFVLLPSGGILLGGEQCERFSRLGNFVPYNSRFIYGVFLEVSAEYILGRHLSFYIAPRMNYLMKTNFDELNVSGSAGVKVYF